MERSELVNSFIELWWLGILQGVLFVFFGVVALFWPGLTLLTLVYLFSGFILGLGIIELIRGLMGINRRSSWWLSALYGVAGLLVGAYLLRHLNVSFTALIIIIGLSLIMRGIFDLVAAFLDGDNKVDKAITGIAGAAGIAAGVIILFQPESGGVAFVWVLGIYSLIAGTMILVTAIGLHDAWRNLQQDLKEMVAAPTVPRQKRA